LSSDTPGVLVRSLRSIAEAEPKVPLLVAASPAYLRAVSEDLNEARGALAEPGLLSIICCGLRAFPGFEDELLPCDDRFQVLLRQKQEEGGESDGASGRETERLLGSKQALNARVLTWLLAEFPADDLRSAALGAEIDNVLRGVDPPERHSREPGSDDEISDWIQAHWERAGSKSALLKAFRADGRACEQSRFGRLYDEVGQTQLSLLSAVRGDE
jgi:hypothetical protein